MSLGERIAQLRREHGLSKAELGRRIGVSDVTVLYWEEGRIVQVGHLNLTALCRTFGCSADDLLGLPAPRWSLIERLTEAVEGRGTPEEVADAMLEARAWLEGRTHDA